MLEVGDRRQEAIPERRKGESISEGRPAFVFSEQQEEGRDLIYLFIISNLLRLPIFSR